MKYLATFTGRLVGAIGIFYGHSVEVEGETEEAARLALYDTHDHITGLSLEPLRAADYDREHTNGGKPLGVWEEVDREAFDEALDVLPPAKMWSGGHAMGEPMAHTIDGRTVWLAYHTRGGWKSAGVRAEGARYWRALVTIRDLDRYLATVPA